MSRSGVTSVTLVVGALCRLWLMADAHLGADNRMKGSSRTLDAYVGIPGFCNKLPQSLFIDHGDGIVEFPNFQEHNSADAKRRSMATRRKQRQRENEVTQMSRTSVTGEDATVTHLRDTSPPSSPSSPPGSPSSPPLSPSKENPPSGGQKKVGASASPAPTAPTAATRGSRWPKGQPVPGPWKMWAAEIRPELDVEKVARCFARYWIAKSGKDATKLDWKATWRNWVESESRREMMKRGTNGGKLTQSEILQRAQAQKGMAASGAERRESEAGDSAHGRLLDGVVLGVETDRVRDH